MNDYWILNQLPELRDLSDNYLEALPAQNQQQADLKRQVIAASRIYEHKK
jgi:hypothetical protein